MDTPRSGKPCEKSFKWLFPWIGPSGLVRSSELLVLLGVTVGLPSHNGNFRYPFSRTPRQHLTRVDRIIMAMTVCSSALRVVCAARAHRVKAAGGKVVTSGKKFANLSEAVDAGLIKVSGALWRRSLKMYNSVL